MISNASMNTTTNFQGGRSLSIKRPSLFAPTGTMANRNMRQTEATSTIRALTTQAGEYSYAGKGSLDVADTGIKLTQNPEGSYDFFAHNTTDEMIALKKKSEDNIMFHILPSPVADKMLSLWSDIQDNVGCQKLAEKLLASKPN